MANSRLLGIAVLALSLAGGAGSIAGCTGLGIDGSPYGEDTANVKPRKSSGATTAASLDGGAGDDDEVAPRATRNNATNSATAADASAPLADSGTTTPTIVTSTCNQKKGLACEDCCVAKTAGGAAISQRIDAAFNDCIFFEQCGGNLDCEDYCSGVAMNQGCSGQTAACDEIDACVIASACYR
jgi:hypothetical protein